METHEFTVEQILDAAALGKFPNTNVDYISYDYNPSTDDRDKIVSACVIGEAFLNLGLTENGVTAHDMSYALQEVLPDESPIRITATVPYYGIVEEEYYNLADFINSLNGYKGWRGKKRITTLAKKYFSKSLNQKVVLKG